MAHSSHALLGLGGQLRRHGAFQLPFSILSDRLRHGNELSRVIYAVTMSHQSPLRHFPQAVAASSTGFLRSLPPRRARDEAAEGITAAFQRVVVTPSSDTQARVYPTVIVHDFADNGIMPVTIPVIPSCRKTTTQRLQTSLRYRALRPGRTAMALMASRLPVWIRRVFTLVSVLGAMSISFSSVFGGICLHTHPSLWQWKKIHSSGRSTTTSRTCDISTLFCTARAGQRSASR